MKNRGVAQLVARVVWDHEVAGSIPVTSTIKVLKTTVFSTFCLYLKLNFTHKTMMNLLYKKAKGLPEEKKTAEVKAMIDTYNQKVDFLDFPSLESIVKEIQK